MEIVKFQGGGQKYNTRKAITKKLACVITLPMTPRMTKLKMITPLGAWQCMREISPLRVFQFSYPILFLWHKFCSRPETKP